VQVAATAPETTGLPVIFPDVAELLAIVALHKPVLSFVRLYPDCNVAEVGQSEKVFCLCCRREGDKEQRKVNNTCSLWRCPTGGCHLFNANNVKTQAHHTVRNVLSWSVMGKVTNYRFNGGL
jgi:hypothetical protein